MNRRRFLRDTALLGGAVVASRRKLAGQQQLPKPKPFLSYMQSASAAAVAFNATNYDPRPGADYRAPTATSIAQDVAALRTAFDGLILYGFDANVTPVVLEEMRRARYRAVMLGIWDPRSRDEVLAVADLADRHARSLAVAVCAGNEGAAFNRYTFEDILSAAALLRRSMRSGDAVALCTSEPLSEYGWAPLRAFGDFVAVNIHPVFDRSELGPADAVAWVVERALTLAEAANKPLLVKETGFPHGRPYTPPLQAAFWSEYVKGQAVQRTKNGAWAAFTAAFESFDLPWKAVQSGIAIEDSWGLMSTARIPYPAFKVWADRQRHRR